MSARPARARPLVALGLALCLCPASGAQILGGPEGPRIEWEQRLGGRVPLAARFRDHEGRALELGSLLGQRPVVLALVYYDCPMLCNLVLEGLLAALREVDLDPGSDFDLLAVSIDPRETSELAAAKRAACLRAYEGSGDGESAASGAADGPPPGGASGWSFLVGEEPEIRSLADAVGFRYSFVPESGEYAHAAGVSVLTPGGELSRVLFGVRFEPRDLRLALVEAAGGRIGSVLDQVLLRCFHYDPARGRYGFAVLASLRLAGIATVLVLAAVVLRHLLRERRAAPAATPDPGRPAT